MVVGFKVVVDVAVNVEDVTVVIDVAVNVEDVAVVMVVWSGCVVSQTGVDCKCAEPVGSELKYT